MNVLSPSDPGASRPKVLVVDDQLSLAETLADGLSERGYDAIPTSSSREAEALCRDETISALVTDLRMPEVDGMALLDHSKRVAPDRPVIVMTAYSAVDSAIESIRRGAYHYLTKPFKLDELALFLGRALDEANLRREAVSLRRVLRDRLPMPELVAESAPMRAVAELVGRLADTDVPVLLTGETGTGKGLVARALHAHGSRASRPFVTVNCTALPETLLESELFGHVKGAFTGATKNRAGLFEEAEGGTLFLDEIGELGLPLQAKLLDVLERGVVRALGSNKERRVDARIVAATHRNLRERVQEGTFREDLLYRLDVVTIELPPLRSRKDDVPILAEHFLREAVTRHATSPVVRFSPAAMARLLGHPFPGNVREIQHLVERLVLLGRSPEIGEADLPPTIGRGASVALDFGGEVLPLREMTRRYVAWAYEQLGHRKLATAERLGIDDKTLARWLARTPEDGPSG
ncbi:MAG TPA: sigma-54 dependent transcriptional regulator [Polyangiaceae bacterium]|nr:sigma-54 dependent transcriptional regulator [Polyangiaceae bacterium]